MLMTTMLSLCASWVLVTADMIAGSES